jgi:hypothetical protein
MPSKLNRVAKPIKFPARSEKRSVGRGPGLRGVMQVSKEEGEAAIAKGKRKGK